MGGQVNSVKKLCTMADRYSGLITLLFTLFVKREKISTINAGISSASNILAKPAK